MKKVFLGGACNGSTWIDALIKDLQIDYFHHCADNWTPDMMKEEIKQRNECDFCLYVVNQNDRSLFYCRSGDHE